METFDGVGVGNNVGVIIMGATNRADILDKALMRAGRFDRQIHLAQVDARGFACGDPKKEKRTLLCAD